MIVSYYINIHSSVQCASVRGCVVFLAHVHSDRGYQWHDYNIEEMLLFSLQSGVSNNCLAHNLLLTVQRIFQSQLSSTVHLEPQLIIASLLEPHQSFFVSFLFIF